jgi:hypothetical protein
MGINEPALLLHLLLWQHLCGTHAQPMHPVYVMHSRLDATYGLVGYVAVCWQ